MKKSQLIKIIKESIKELMIKEQFSGPNWDALQQAWSSSTPPSPPQPFQDRMANMGCGGMQSRMSHLYNKLTQQLGSNTAFTSATPSGTNPLWQGQIASKIYWLINTGIPNCN